MVQLSIIVKMKWAKDPSLVQGNAWMMLNGQTELDIQCTLSAAVSKTIPMIF